MRVSNADCMLGDREHNAFADIAELLVSHGADREVAREYYHSRFRVPSERGNDVDDKFWRSAWGRLYTALLLGSSML